MHTPRLELRLPSAQDLDDLADLAAEGVHPADYMPFTYPWTDAPPAEVGQRAVLYHLRTLGSWTPEKWRLPLAVVHDGEIAGIQEVGAEDFAVVGEVGTGSWLGRRFQGRGIGTEMRRAVLHLAFEGLRARAALTDIFEDNHASLGVTRKLGYLPNGSRSLSRRGEAATQLLFRLPRTGWRPEPGYEISGLRECLPWFGGIFHERDGLT
ncbi:GNAT family N-acetyltransferase [Nonomuraea longicatena]|uniref:GNAT family N-acetyltransferase n=1 Tax=Nonomuraea longicatena TaxID=83682 RepID=UPI0031CE3914